MIVASSALSKVAAADTCAGCGLCAGISEGAIRMEVAEPGFARPRQVEALPEEVEASIGAACPGIVSASWQDGPRHPLWGPYLRCATGHVTDAGLRHASSSGGLLSGLLIHALETGLVDAVLQVTADPAFPTRNALTISRTAQEVKAAAGSRYAPSSPLTAIADLLSSAERWAVVVKPCDASALRRMAQRDHRVHERIPLILSFFCGGIPSHSGAQAILTELQVAEGDLRSFRYRGDGWPGYATATRRDGTTERMSYMDSWGRLLSPTMQYRCKICPDAVGGVADIACADAWHGDERGYPLFEEEDGRSLVIARTDVGLALLDAATKAGRIQTNMLPAGAIDAMQPGQVRRKRVLLARLLGAALAGQWTFRPHNVGIWRAAARASLLDSVRNFVGTFRRTLKQRRSRRP